MWIVSQANMIQNVNYDCFCFLCLFHSKMILACSRNPRPPHNPRKPTKSLPLPRSQANKNQGEDCSVMKTRKKGEGCLVLLLQSHSLKLKWSQDRQQKRRSACSMMMNRMKKMISLLLQQLPRQTGNEAVKWICWRSKITAYELWNRCLFFRRTACQFSHTHRLLPLLLCFETSVVFFAVARVLISVCWLFSVTAKKEPSKEEPKEKVKVRKLVTFRVNRSQNFRVVSAAGIIATLRCTESNGRQIHVTVHVC